MKRKIRYWQDGWRLKFCELDQQGNVIKYFGYEGDEFFDKLDLELEFEEEIQALFDKHKSERLEAIKKKFGENIELIEDEDV